MKRSLFGTAALAVVALSAVLIGPASAAKPPPTNSGGCPNGSLTNYPESSIVGAGFTQTDSKTLTYKFISEDQSPTGGVPGLVGFCVYGANVAPDTVATTVKGFDGSTWKASKPGKSFGFTRPGGESSNIPLDGKTVDPIGSATWFNTFAVPTTQKLLLHISGTSVCNGQPTCYVRPTLVQTGTLTVQKVVINDNGGTKIATDFKFKVNGGTATTFTQDGSDTLAGKNTVTIPSGAYSVVEDGTPITGYGTTLSAGCSGNMPGGGSATCTITNDDSPPICNAGTGNTGAAYNAIPTDVQHCSPPSWGFEATQTNEFGDEVVLSVPGPGFAGSLHSITVDFQSYGCSDSGHWNTGDCVTTPGATFTVPGGITMNLYDPNGSGGLVTPIASQTINPNLPFRPSATALDVNCPNPPGDPNAAADSRFKDTISGQCNYSFSVPLTVFFPVGTLLSNNQTVVWTAEFNTTHYGYSPIGEGEACFTANAGNPGCGYDSLNVGVKSYPNAPYAGVDLSENVAYRSFGGPLQPLASETGWLGLRPLGQIVVS
jgi:hypothetical protein